MLGGTQSNIITNGSPLNQRRGSSHSEQAQTTDHRKSIRHSAYSLSVTNTNLSMAFKISISQIL